MSIPDLIIQTNNSYVVQYMSELAHTYTITYTVNNSVGQVYALDRIQYSQYNTIQCNTVHTIRYNTVQGTPVQNFWNYRSDSFYTNYLQNTCLLYTSRCV